MNRWQIYCVFALSVVVTLAVLYFIEFASGAENAIDSRLFPLSILLLFVTSFGIGYLFPVGAWRWGMATWVGHIIYIMLPPGSNIWPIAIAFALVYCLPHVVAAAAGAWLKLRLS